MSGVQTQLTEERVRNMREWFSKISMDGEYAEVAVALADAYLAQQKALTEWAEFLERNAAMALEVAQSMERGSMERREYMGDANRNGTFAAKLRGIAAVSVGSPETRETE